MFNRRIRELINMKRVEVVDLAKEDSLKNLLQEYIRRSEELERRESKVMRQVQMMQSAVTSLMEWSDHRRTSEADKESGNTSVRKIEEETRQIKEETKRIQNEVKQKMEDNKKLEEVVKMKKIERSEAEYFVKRFLEQRQEEEAQPEKDGVREAQSRAPSETDQEDMGIQFFQEKLERLMELEKRLRQESDAESEQARVRETSLKQKVEGLERGLETDRRRILCLKGKPCGPELPGKV